MYIYIQRERERETRRERERKTKQRQIVRHGIGYMRRHRHISAYINIHTCIHTYIQTYIHTYMPTYVSTYLHIITCVHYTHPCMHTPIHACRHTPMHACTHISTYTYFPTYVHMQYANIYKYTTHGLSYMHVYEYAEAYAFTYAYITGTLSNQELILEGFRKASMNYGATPNPINP